MTVATVFDLASVSKVVATTTMAMILYERGLIDLEAPVASIVPEFSGTDARRGEVTVRMLLAHSSGLPAYEKLFLKAKTRDELLAAAFATPLTADPGARAEYSDIGFIILAIALERIADESLDRFCQREIFGPLGMAHTAFNPPAAWRASIPPTADDRSFRNRIIQGEVQDENASVLGGVAGHAGLFATAEDLATFAHVLLQGGAPLVRPETLALFTRRETAPAGTSRALGWDTPSSPSQSGKYFSARSFGHLGYTGTSLWIDPERGLSITLLTNRTWPDCDNKAIKDVRPAFHDAVVEALERKALKRRSSTPQEDLSHLTTEQTNRASTDLDLKSALEVVRVINAEDGKVVAAVQRALPQIARGVGLIANALQRGGRLIYVGAGTSGRIAALDAAECPPTFDVDPRTVQFIMAGGPAALAAALEANEDSRELGKREMAKRKPGRNDVVVGIAASGRTPFTIAAIEYARSKGAQTISVTCNRNTPLQKAAQLGIVTEVGPEVISGSTRMKAGTAQKMVLNMLSSGAMTRLGYVYGNLMVHVTPRNSKLAARSVSILQQAAGVGAEIAAKALQVAGNSVPVALVMLQAEVDRREAERALEGGRRACAAGDRGGAQFVGFRSAGVSPASRGHPALGGGGGTPPRQPPGRRRYQTRRGRVARDHMITLTTGRVLRSNGLPYTLLRHRH